jgi:hypothetical protein
MYNDHFWALKNEIFRGASKVQRTIFFTLAAQQDLDMNDDPAWEEIETRSLTGTDALANRVIPVPWGT